MKSDQDLYKQLRDLPKELLWSHEVERFNAADARERMDRVAVIRAVGMIFGRFGSEEEKETVRTWLVSLLNDPQEKIRRYAANALPKVGAGEQGEAGILGLLRNGSGAREQRHLGRALEKVGGAATLAMAGEGVLPSLTEQKVRAGVARRENPATLVLAASLRMHGGQRLHLRCRRGLEQFVKEEAREKLAPSFRIGAVRPGCVTIEATATFSLGDLYRLRCFATLGFHLGKLSDTDPDWVEKIAACIVSPAALAIMTGASTGVPRYRIEFTERGHQRGAIRRVIDRAYALEPRILNDAREAPWSIDVIPTGEGRRESFVELRPRLYPDPRLAYRQDDIAAASHPPLAACMARLAGPYPAEVVWDPFCGSGLELVERGLLGGVSALHGTDLDPKAIAIAKLNISSADLSIANTTLSCRDFREARLPPGSVTLMITNPPLGRRVRVKDLRGLIADLFATAGNVLAPSGRLVVVNPLRLGPEDPSLTLEYQQEIDMGGFECRLEMYRKKKKNLELRNSGKR